MRYFIALAVTASTLALTPAQAAVTLDGYTLGPGNFGSGNGVHGADQTANDNIINAVVNNFTSENDANAVTFSTTSGTLNIGAGGEATISGSDGLKNLTVVFGTAWNRMTFAFQGSSTFSLLVNDSTLFDTPACVSDCSIGNGNSHFILSKGQLAPLGISKLVFQFSGDGTDAARQFRVQGVSNAPAVPEPASWAMMIGGLGLVGGLMRRRATKLQFA